jgi:hypothetical protein
MSLKFGDGVAVGHTTPWTVGLTRLQSTNKGWWNGRVEATRANISGVIVAFDTAGDVGHTHDFGAACASTPGLSVGSSPANMTSPAVSLVVTKT